MTLSLLIGHLGKLLPGFLHLQSAAAGVPVPDAGTAVLRNVSWALLVMLGLLVLLALIPLVFSLYRRLFSSLAQPEIIGEGDPAGKAEQMARKGDYLGAAELLEMVGQTARAATLFEKGKDLTRAAELWEAVGELERAVQLHLRGGGSLRAAAIYVRQGKYTDAAKIFKNKGDHFRAAQALEKGGSKAAAAREYQEAQQYARAARLFREAHFFAEAAEAYHLSLGTKGISPATLESYYTYGAYLLLAGEREKTLDIYGRILVINPGHARTREKLAELGQADRKAAVPEALRPQGAPAVPAGPPPAATRPPPGDMESSLSRELGEGEAVSGESGDPFERVMTLRNMITHTRLDIKYSMRLWVQMMRALGEKHRVDKVFYGCLTPEQVLIDMQNNIRFEIAWVADPDYTAPEVREGAVPDAQADIYSMGVMFYEMVSGSLESLGQKRPRELRDDVPEWLDDLIMRCIDPDRGKRFARLEEVSAALVRLKSSL